MGTFMNCHYFEGRFETCLYKNKMGFNLDKHHRHSIRLKDYNYSQSGAYFVTICIRHHESILGKINDGKMSLYDAGQIVKSVWEELPNHYNNVELDTFVIMPNHVHGIIMLGDSPDAGAGLKPALNKKAYKPERAGLKPAPTKHGIPEIIRAFKTFSSRKINQIRGTIGTPFWQRNYYEHIIRDEQSLDDIRQYISGNPMCWADDEENPINLVGAGLKPALNKERTNPKGQV